MSDSSRSNTGHPDEASSGNATRPGRCKDHALHFLELLGVALIATVLGAVGAHLHPTQSVGINLTIPAQPPVIGEKTPDRVIGVAFFLNGSSHLDESSKSTVDRWAHGLRDCTNLHISVSGTASSAAYANGTKGSNLQLANDRAQGVLRRLELQGVRGAEFGKVKLETELPSRRLLNDHPGLKRDKALEALSRRADLDLVDLGSCREVDFDEARQAPLNPRKTTPKSER